jgi:beta-galactosidase GanA
MTSDKICERCRELYGAYKNSNEAPTADVYSAQAAAWRDLQAHLKETNHDLQSVIIDWSGMSTNEGTAR